MAAMTKLLVRGARTLRATAGKAFLGQGGRQAKRWGVRAAMREIADVLKVAQPRRRIQAQFIPLGRC